MSQILLVGYVFFLPLFFAVVGTAITKRRWGFIALSLFPLALYAAAVLFGVAGLAGARHASDSTMQEGGLILLGVLAIAWLAVLCLLYFVRKSDDRPPGRRRRRMGPVLFIAAVVIAFFSIPIGILGMGAGLVVIVLERRADATAAAEEASGERAA
jgi:hypothetical protein